MSALRGLSRPATILRRARAAIPALRELLAEEPGPRTSLDRVVGQDRILALVRSSLESVGEVAHRHEAKVNDVLLAVIAGGLRNLLRSRGEPIEAVTLPIYVPVSLRRVRSGQLRGNSDQSDGRPASLLGSPILPGGFARSHTRPPHGKRSVVRRWAPCSATGSSEGSMLKLIVRQRVNVVSADLPGPDTPRYFAGAG